MIEILDWDKGGLDQLSFSLLLFQEAWKANAVA